MYSKSSHIGWAGSLAAEAARSLFAPRAKDNKKYEDVYMSPFAIVPLVSFRPFPTMAIPSQDKREQKLLGDSTSNEFRRQRRRAKSRIYIRLAERATRQRCRVFVL